MSIKQSSQSANIWEFSQYGSLRIKILPCAILACIGIVALIVENTYYNPRVLSMNPQSFTIVEFLLLMTTSWLFMSFNINAGVFLYYKLKKPDIYNQMRQIVNLRTFIPFSAKTSYVGAPLSIIVHGSSVYFIWNPLIVQYGRASGVLLLNIFALGGAVVLASVIWSSYMYLRMGFHVKLNKETQEITIWGRSFTGRKTQRHYPFKSTYSIVALPFSPIGTMNQNTKWVVLFKTNETPLEGHGVFFGTKTNAQEFAKELARIGGWTAVVKENESFSTLNLKPE